MEIVANFSCGTGESPLWHQGDRALYWCDVPSGKIYRWDALTGNCGQIAAAGESIGGMTIEADGALLCFLRHGRIARWHDGQWSTVLEPCPQLVADRFNDVIAQPDGSVLCGTMPDKDGQSALFHLNHRRQLHLVMSGIKLANGLGYSPDLDRIYFADTRNYAIYEFDYDLTTCFPENPRLLIDFHDRPGRPDGLTVDRGGDLWVAEIGAGQLVRFDCCGREKQCLPIPVDRVTSLCFGGCNLRTVFVTTAADGNKVASSSAGATFALQLTDAVGLLEFNSTIACQKSRW